MFKVLHLFNFYFFVQWFEHIEINELNSRCGCLELLLFYNKDTNLAFISFFKLFRLFDKITSFHSPKILKVPFIVSYEN